MDTNTKKPIFKQWWFWLIAVIVLGFLIQTFASKETKQKWASEDSTKQAQAKIQQAQSERQSWLPIYCKYLGDRKDTAKVIFTEANSWDVYSLIRNHFNHAIEFGQKAFKADSQMQAFIMITKSVLKDANGNLDTTITLMHTFPRDAFMKIKWENFKHESIALQISRTANDAYIHPALKKDIDEEGLIKNIYLE